MVVSCFCAVVRAGVRCCVCALLGLCVARAPCPGVLLRRRGDTPSLWRARLAPWRALLVPGCGPARGSGVCARWGGGVRTPLLVFPALSLCPSSPACPACPPSSYPLGWPWPVGWSWRSDIVFLSCRAAWAGFVLGAGCSCGVPRRLAPVHRCARSVCGVVCTVSWASRLLFTGVHALRVVSRVRRPGPPSSCSPVCTPCVWCRVYGVLGLPAPVHRCARSACGVACTASWASRLLFTGAHALRVALRVRRPGPPGSCSPVCTPCVWRRVYGVLGLPAPVHRCARSACGVACTASWASRLLFTGVHALRVVSCVRCPGPPGSCSPVCTPCVWCCVYGVLGLPAPVHRCARPVCGVACTASWASRPLFTGAHALRVALRVRRPGPPGSCSPACTLCVWCCVYGVLGLPAPVHRCARPACGVACTASWASRLLFTGAHALRVALRVQRPGPPGSRSPVCTPCVWCRVYCVLGLPAPVHRCARLACGVACTASSASRLLFTGVHVLCAVSRVRCPGRPGSCSPVCTLCVWRCVYGVLGLPAPVHRCARSVCGVACTASWASRLLFAGAHALRVVLRVRRPGPPGSCLPVCTLFVWCRVYGVLGLPAPVHRCARPVCGVACTVPWAPWLLFTGAHALRVVLCVPCPGPPGSCSPVCTLCVGVWWRVGVLGGGVGVSLRVVLGVVPLGVWFAFTGHSPLRVARARWSGSPSGWWRRVLTRPSGVVLRVRRPGPPGSCSPVCTLCVYGVLGLPAPVHRCARPACGVACTVSWAFRLLFTGVQALCACAVSWASRLLFTGVHVLCVVVRVRRPGPPGSRSPVCTLCVWCCVYGVLGLPARVHRCARPVRGVACAVWPFCACVVRVVLCVWCPGTLGSCSPVSRCVAVCVWCPVCGAACAVSWASRPLFTGARARCVAWCVRCGCECVLACAIPFVFADTFFFTLCSLWRLIYSSRFGLFDFGDAQE